MDAFKNVNFNNIDLSTIKNNTKGVDNVELPPEQQAMIDNVSSFVDEARKSKVLTCDAECQRTEKERLLYNDYLQAKQNAQQAPGILEETERNFYEFSEGSEAYEKRKEKELTIQANTEVDTINKEYNIILSRTQELFDQYTSQKVYIENMDETKMSYDTKIKGLRKSIDTTTNTKNINNRMDYYISEKEQLYKTISNTLHYIFYIILSIFSLYFVVYKGQFRNWKILLIIFVGFFYHSIISFVFSEIGSRL